MQTQSSRLVSLTGIHKQRALGKAIALVVLTASSAGVVAQNATQLPTTSVGSDNQDSYRVDRMQSPAYTQPLIETPKTVTIISSAAMRDRGVDSLSDALRGVPGVSMAAGEGGAPTGDSMTIRGFDARTDVFVDGIRDIAGYYRDTYNMESVEVAKGPGSSVTGRGSTGGSINLQSKTAQLDKFTDVRLRAGSESDYRITLDTNHRLGDNSAIRINLLTDDVDTAGRDEANSSKNSIAVSLGFGLETPSRFTLNGELQEQDNLPDYGLPWVSNSAPVAELAAYNNGAPPADFDNFYGNVFRDYEEIESNSLTAKFEHDFSQQSTLRLQARHGSVARESVVSAPRFIDVSTSTDVRQSDEKTRDTENSLDALQVDWIGNYEFGAVGHELVIGAALSSEVEKRWTLDDNGTDNLDTTPVLVDLYNPNSREPYFGNYQRVGNNTKAQGDTLAVYIFDTLSLNDKLELTGGLRWEDYDTTYHYSYTDPSLVLNRSDSYVAWNAAAVYKLADNGNIYFGVGKSLNPTAEDLTASSNSSSNDANLDPEESYSYELGTKWELADGNLLLSAALFRTEKTNARTDDPDVDAPSRYDRLDGEQRVDGLELSVVGQVNNTLSVTAGYTFQDSEVVKALGDDAVTVGNELARTPRHSWSMWGNYAMNDKLNFGLGAQYMGERYSSINSNRRKAGDYTLLDFMATYQASPNVALQFNISNLTDEDYEGQLGGGHFIPGEGRYSTLSASYSF